MDEISTLPMEVLIAQLEAGINRELLVAKHGEEMVAEAEEWIELTNG